MGLDSGVESWEKLPFYTCEVDGQHVSLRESCQLRGSEQQQTSESERMENNLETNLALSRRSHMHVSGTDRGRMSVRSVEDLDGFDVCR
jgi:hypothetical protein